MSDGHGNATGRSGASAGVLLSREDHQSVQAGAWVKQNPWMPPRPSDYNNFDVVRRCNPTTIMWVTRRRSVAAALFPPSPSHGKCARIFLHTLS